MPDESPPSHTPDSAPPGLIHTYLAYDPKNFPSPTAPAPDIASGALEHMLAHGDMRELTDEELANAVRIDPSMFPSLGPSLESLAALLRERKQKILETYETEQARERAARAVRNRTREANPPKESRDAFNKAARSGQLRDLERLWYEQKREDSPFALDLMRLIDATDNALVIEQTAGKYAFTGRTPMDVDEALAISAELETIDRLLEQIEEAMKNAKIGIIDMEALSAYADPGDIEALNQLQHQIEEFVKREAERQGVEKTREGYRLTPQAYRIFQNRLLQEIFSDLQAARSGRHQGDIVGDGVIEIARTKGYEFGDAASNLDVVQTLTNALLRTQREHQGESASLRDGAIQSPRRPIRLRSDDIEVHLTRNAPKCATCVLLDMSGSMRHGGQYIHVKRMGLALDGLIRSEYPGDFLQFIELFTFAKPRHISEIATLMPKPVSIFSPTVRLRADMSDPRVSELRVPQHFTNIQRGLQLSRQFLSAQDTPNRQVVLITDGLPTAHFESEMLYMLYPPDPRTEEATMREANLCAREGVTINIFLLPSWSQTSEDVQFAQRMAQSTKGRVFFTGGKNLDRFVLWDYVNQRRKIIG